MVMTITTRVINLGGYRKTSDCRLLEKSIRADHAKISSFLIDKPSSGIITGLRAVPDQMSGISVKETYRVLLFVKGRTMPFEATLPCGISEGTTAARLMGTAENLTLEESHARAARYLHDVLEPRLVGRHVADLLEIEAEFKAASDDARSKNPELGPYEIMGAQNSLGITNAIALAIAGLVDVPPTSVINFFYNKILEEGGHNVLELPSLPKLQGVKIDAGAHGLELTLDQMVAGGIMTQAGKDNFPVNLGPGAKLPVIPLQEVLTLYHNFPNFRAMIKASEKITMQLLKLFQANFDPALIHRGAEAGITSPKLHSINKALTLMQEAYDLTGYTKNVASSLDCALSGLVLTPEGKTMNDILVYLGPEIAQNETGVVPLPTAYERVVAIAKAFGMPIVEDLAPEADALRGLSRPDQIKAMALAGKLLEEAGIACVADDTTTGNPELLDELVIRNFISDCILGKDTQSGTFHTYILFNALATLYGILKNGSHRGNAVSDETIPGYYGIGLGNQVVKFTGWGRGRGAKITAMMVVDEIYRRQGIRLPFWGNPEDTGTSQII